jgi:hypothetical protein
MVQPWQWVDDAIVVWKPELGLVEGVMDIRMVVEWWLGRREPSVVPLASPLLLEPWPVPPWPCTPWLVVGGVEPSTTSNS